MAIEVKINLRGNRRATRGMAVLASNIDNVIFVTGKVELKEIRRLMVLKIKKFAFEGDLERGILLDAPKKEENNSVLRLRSTAKHSGVMEQGTRERWVHVPTYPKLQRWIHSKYYGDADVVNPKWIKVGGRGTRYGSSIEQGNSRNKFFFNTIDQYSNSGRFLSKMQKGLQKAIKRSFKKK